MSGARHLRLPASGRAGERLVTAAMWLVAGGVAAALVWILAELLWHGVGRIGVGFLTEPPSRAGRAGGIASVLVATLWILAVAMLASVPLGLCTAVWLGEYARRGGWASIVVGRSLDVLAAVPSIVFGLFGNAVFCHWMGLGYSILAGGLTLACMILPILVRATEAALRSVPNDYRVAATALGISRTRATVSVMLPSAATGLAVGVVLGTGRAVAETAALLFTSGYVDRMPRGVMDSGRALSVHIYDLAMNVPGGEPNAYAAAVVLVGILVLMNVGTHRITRLILAPRGGSA